MSNAIIPFSDLQKIGQAMARSGYFADSKDEAQAIVKVLAGHEIGLGPFASMTGIHIIKGKPVLGANILATLIKNDPRYNYRIVEHTDKACEIEFYENGQSVGTSRITIEELKKAGSQNLDKYPRNMLFARAISNGAKWHTPGVFGGAPVYTPDEFGLEVDDEGELIIDAIPREHQPEPEPVNGKQNGTAPQDWKEGALEWMEKEGIAENHFNAQAIWKLCRLDEVKTKSEAVKRVTAYREARNAGMATDVAAEVAIFGAVQEAE